MVFEQALLSGTLAGSFEIICQIRQERHVMIAENSRWQMRQGSQTWLRPSGYAL